MAQDNGVIDSNPCRKVKKLRQDNQRNRFLTAEEEERLLSVCVGPRLPHASYQSVNSTLACARGICLALLGSR